MGLVRLPLPRDWRLARSGADSIPSGTPLRSVGGHPRRDRFGVDAGSVHTVRERGAPVRGVVLLDGFTALIAALDAVAFLDCRRRFGLRPLPVPDKFFLCFAPFFLPRLRSVRLLPEILSIPVDA
ncbi:MAG: hypothetical protein ABS980_05165 [Rhodococcus sp. (in: high G+C Gram-positive bacteria)]